MARLSKSFVVAVGLMALAGGPAWAVNDALSDADLIARTSAVLASKDAPPDRIIGLYKNLAVVVDLRCSDACPQSTVRIVHFAGTAEAACAQTAGDLVTVAVPRGLTSGPEKFCVPRILVSRKLYTDRPYQK